MSLSDLEAEVAALRAENEALRVELIEARKTIKLLKLLDAGVPSSELTTSQNARKATLDAEIREEREARDKSKKFEASVSVLGVPGTPEEKKREKSPSRSTASPARHSSRDDESSSSVFSFLTVDPIERFGHVFRFKKDAPDAVLKEIQISAPADFRPGDGMQALPIAKLPSGSTSDPSSPKTRRADLLVFGTPLDVLMKGGAIPPFLVQAFTFLEPSLDKHGLLTQFSTASNVPPALRARFVLTAVPDFAGLNADAVSSLVIAFFEELPDVLLSLPQLQRLIQTMAITDRSYKLLSQRLILMSLPANTRTLLDFVIKFLKKVIASKGNTATELGKLFGPFLFKLRFVSPRPGEARPTAEETAKVLSSILDTSEDLLSIEADADRKWAVQENCLQLKFGSPARVVELFSVFCYSEPHFIDVFALTRSYFMTATETLNAFIQVYGVFKGNEPWQRTARTNILANLRSWAEQQRHRLLEERGFVSSLNAFVSPLNSTATDEEKPHLEALSSCFEKHSLLRSNVTMNSFGKFAQVRRTMRDKVPDMNILEIDAVAAAAQMTLLDHSLFAQIPMDEFLFKRFTKPEQCPSFTEFAAKFEQWGLWVASQVVSRKTSSERAEHIEKMISVAHQCIKLNNYNTAAAMLYGLFNRSVTRLKNTWLKVDKKRLAEMKKIEALFATSRNYKTYREVLANAMPPLVPHIALVPKDLFAIEETNPTLVDNLVNLDKMRLLHNLLSRIHRWQTISYKTLHPDEQLLAYFKQLRYMPDDTLYEISRESEPHKK